MCLGMIVTALLAVAAVPAQAGAASVTVDNAAPKVEEVEGGGFKLSVGLTNITDDDVSVGIADSSPTLSNGCVLEVGGDPTATVRSATHEDVELTFGAGCVAADVDRVVAHRRHRHLAADDPARTAEPDEGHAELGSAGRSRGRPAELWSS